MSDDVSDTFSMRLLDDTATSVWGDGIGWIQIWQDNLRYQDDIGWTDVKSISDNTWYHIKIEFECTTGNYQGLSQDTWRFYVNGETFGDFNFLNDISNVTQIYCFTRGADTNYRCYTDAFGFSWDSNYDIGDNLNEGLLLSFDNTTSLDWMGYSLDGLANKTILGNRTIPMPLDGTHNIQVFGNDSLGEWYESEIQYFSVDISGPSIIINSPSQNSIFNNSSPNYEVIITDFNLDKMWYSLDEDINNISFTELTGKINQDEWDKQVDGNVTLRFYANDTFGHTNIEEVIIEKDTINPFISINSPNTNEFFAMLPPDYDLSITELNLDTTWYTIDNGLTNITFTGLTGRIDQTEWDKAIDGGVSIKFYANDTVGNSNYIEINIYKDTTVPIITINSPMTGDEFYELPPEFNLTVDELHLDSTWYTIDGGLTIFTFAEMTGFIDSTAWNEAPIGAVTFRFYARDMAGNEVYQEVVVLKRTSEEPPGIPGYDIFLLFGIVFITSGLLIRKRLKD